MTKKNQLSSTIISNSWVGKWSVLHDNNVAPHDEFLNISGIFFNDISFKTYINDTGNCEPSQFIGVFDNHKVKGKDAAVLTVLFQDKEVFDRQIKEIEKIKDLLKSGTIFNPALFLDKTINNEGYINIEYLKDLDFENTSKFDGLGSTIYTFSYKGDNFFRLKGISEEYYGFILLSKRENIKHLKSFAEEKIAEEITNPNFAKMTLEALKCSDEKCFLKIFNTKDYFMTYLSQDMSGTTHLAYHTYKHVHNYPLNKSADILFKIDIDKNNQTKIVVNSSAVVISSLELGLLKAGYEKSDIEIKNKSMIGKFLPENSSMPTVKYRSDKMGTFYTFEK